jgi:hypothetical protein
MKFRQLHSLAEKMEFADGRMMRGGGFRKTDNCGRI